MGFDYQRKYQEVCRVYEKKVEISTAKIDMYIWWLIKIPLSGNGHYIYCILYILYIIYTEYYLYTVYYMCCILYI